MAELVDAADLKSADRKVVGVQVPLRALLLNVMKVFGVSFLDIGFRARSHEVESICAIPCVLNE